MGDQGRKLVKKKAGENLNENRSNKGQVTSGYIS
jgi:hypothetical protein